MKKLLLSLFLVLMIGSSAFAAQVLVKWQPSERAKGYKIYISDDNGQSWTVLEDDIPQNQTQAVIEVPDHKLILIRVSAYNDFGETINSASGAFFNSDWRRPEMPSQIGLQWNLNPNNS